MNFTEETQEALFSSAPSSTAESQSLMVLLQSQPRKRGRPRKNPSVDRIGNEKRPRGRPRKDGLLNMSPYSPPLNYVMSSNDMSHITSDQPFSPVYGSQHMSILQPLLFPDIHSETDKNSENIASKTDRPRREYSSNRYKKICAEEISSSDKQLSIISEPTSDDQKEMSEKPEAESAASVTPEIVTECMEDLSSLNGCNTDSPGRSEETCQDRTNQRLHSKAEKEPSLSDIKIESAESELTAAEDCDCEPIS